MEIVSIMKSFQSKLKIFPTARDPNGSFLVVFLCSLASFTGNKSFTSQMIHCYSLNRNIHKLQSPASSNICNGTYIFKHHAVAQSDSLRLQVHLSRLSTTFSFVQPYYILCAPSQIFLRHFSPFKQHRLPPLHPLIHSSPDSPHRSPPSSPNPSAHNSISSSASPQKYKTKTESARMPLPEIPAKLPAQSTPKLLNIAVAKSGKPAPKNEPRTVLAAMALAVTIRYASMR